MWRFMNSYYHFAVIIIECLHEVWCYLIGLIAIIVSYYDYVRMLSYRF